MLRPFGSKGITLNVQYIIEKKNKIEFTPLCEQFRRNLFCYVMIKKLFED